MWLPGRNQVLLEFVSMIVQRSNVPPEPRAAVT